MNTFSAAVAPPSRSTTSKYSPNLGWSQPRCTSWSLFDSGLQFHVKTRLITASQCISEFTQSWSPIASPTLLDYSLRVYPWFQSILASKSISELARLRPSSTSLSPHDLSHQWHLQIRSITASKCISKLDRSRPPSQSLSSLDLSLQLHFETRLITASQYISLFTRSQSAIASSNWFNHGVQVHLQGVTRSIYSGEPSADIIPFSSHLIIQRNYALYVSQLLVSLTSSEIAWIHAIAWILIAGYYHMFSQSSYAPRPIPALSYELYLDVVRVVEEYWWQSLCLLSLSFHYNGIQVVHL